MDEFSVIRGSENFKRPEVIVLMVIISCFLGYIVSKGGLLVSAAISALVMGLVFLAAVLMSPRIGFIAVLTLNFFALGIYRYLTMVPWGLTVDIMLVITYISVFFRSFHHRLDWSRARSELTVVAFIWFGYSLFELVNPEAGSRVGWFYAVRGVSLYMLMTIPLVFVIFSKLSDLRFFLILWGVFSLLGTLKGLQQKFIGVDPFEQRWLDSGGAAQHLLFGELRIFSFYSDAGQFGASQGQAGVVFSLLALGEKNFKRRIFYAMVALAGLFGMMISGTRGALAVPFAGIVLYIILKKNVKVMAAGVLALIVIFVFFKFTYIGQGNSTIRRMRSAFDTKDASLQTRLDNQKRLKAYLASRPLGGGLGAVGGIGQKYNPGSFLSTVPSDSWYVQIWMENGIIGLILHLSLLFFILGRVSYNIMFRIRNDEIKIPTTAMAAGMFGIMAASYGNTVLGQMPTGIMLYTCMVFMYMAPQYDRELTLASEQKPVKAYGS